MEKATSQHASIPKVVTISLVMKGTTSADTRQPGATRATCAKLAYRMSEMFLKLSTIAIWTTSSLIEDYRTSRRFLESSDI